MRFMAANLSMDAAGTFSGFEILSAMGVGTHLWLRGVERAVPFWAPSERQVRVITACEI
jgi:hypothetical protein